MLTLVALLVMTTTCSLAWYGCSAAATRWQPWWRNRGPHAAYVFCLSAVVTLAAALRVWLVPAHHAMYVDEPWYAEAACNLIRGGRLELCEATWSGASCEPFAKGLGWPVLLVPWFMIGGCSSLIAIHVSQCLGVVSVLLVAWVARGAGVTRWQSLLGATLLSFHPVHVAWSATAETNVPQATVWLLGIGAALRYVESARPAAAALAITSLSLATAMRPEALAPTLAVAGALGWMSAAPMRQRVTMAVALAVVATAAAMTALPLWNMNRELSSGVFFSFSNVVTNLGKLHDQGALAVHAWIGVLALVAICAALPTNGKRPVVLLLPAAVAAVLVALSYDRFHERMLLNATVTLLAMSPWLAAWPASLPLLRSRTMAATVAAIVSGTTVVLLSLGMWSPALEAIVTPAESQLLETQLAARLASLQLPVDSLVLAEEPTVVAAAGLLPAMPTRKALADGATLKKRVGDGLATYFLCDMYCEPEFQGAASGDRCNQVLGMFNLEEVVSTSLHDRNYILYRLSDSPLGAAPRRCPRAEPFQTRTTGPEAP